MTIRVILPLVTILKQTRYRALQRQVKRLEQRLAHLNQISQRYAFLRAVIFFGGLSLAGLGWVGWGTGWLFWLSLAATLSGFGPAVFYHRRIERAIARSESWRRHKSGQLARMSLDWPHLPYLSRPTPRPDHPFEADLDLVGEHSLHRLLDTTVSREGSQWLRQWLTGASPDLSQTRQRQQVVRELAPRHLFRDKLILQATLAAERQKMWEASRLIDWLAQTESETNLRGWLILLTLFTGLNLALFVLDRWGLIPAIWPATFTLYFGLLYLRASRSGDLLNQAVILQDAIEQLGAVARQLERYSYRHTPHLKTLCRPFLDKTNRPSGHIRRVRGVVSLLSLRENPFMWFILNAVSPWDAWLAYRLNHHKQILAQHLPQWLAIWFELEALSALANLAYLNPEYTFPTLTDLKPGSKQPIFTARQLGHPLLPDLPPQAEKVTNDFSINTLGEIAIITGSNMAGKSTFLRTVGLNLALAYAGGPVSARHFEAIPLRLFTTIKISDSVTSGVSYFYAEVKRLKALLDALQMEHEQPLFFFIDEIFRGTNNRERFIGSRAYLQSVVGQHGVGLISTHDLELIHLADHNPQLTNYHFRDDVVNEEMVFDYRLRPGPCPTTNALKIMALEGLPVEPDPPSGVTSLE